jgi:hypothetical protein
MCKQCVTFVFQSQPGSCAYDRAWSVSDDTSWNELKPLLRWIHRPSNRRQRRRSYCLHVVSPPPDGAFSLLCPKWPRLCICVRRVMIRTYIQQEHGSSSPVLIGTFEASTSSSQIPAYHLNNTKTASFQIPSNLTTSRSNKRPPGYLINTRRQTQSRGELSDMSCEELHCFSRHSVLDWGSNYNTPLASLHQGEVPQASSLLGCEAVRTGKQSPRSRYGILSSPPVPNCLNVLRSAQPEDAGKTLSPRPSLLYPSPYGVTSRKT